MSDDWRKNLKKLDDDMKFKEPKMPEYDKGKKYVKKMY